MGRNKPDRCLEGFPFISISSLLLTINQCLFFFSVSTSQQNFYFKNFWISDYNPYDIILSVANKKSKTYPFKVWCCVDPKVITLWLHSAAALTTEAVWKKLAAEIRNIINPLQWNWNASSVPCSCVSILSCFSSYASSLMIGVQTMGGKMVTPQLLCHFWWSCRDLCFRPWTLYLLGDHHLHWG